MNLSTAILLVNPAVRVIEAIYEPDGKGPDHSKPEKFEAKRELFKTFDEAIKVDDLLIVPSTTRHCVTTVKVTGVDVDWDPDTSAEVKWIIQSIDMSAFNEAKALDAKMFKAINDAEKTDKRNKLREKMLAHMDEDAKAKFIAAGGIGALSHAPAEETKR